MSNLSNLLEVLLNEDLDDVYNKLLISYEDEDEKKPTMILPEIIHETKNNIYVAKFPNGKKEVDILKPTHGEPFDLEKGLLYYVIKHNLDLGKVLDWMKPILDENNRPENAEKHKKQISAKINKWFLTKDDEPINDKECQKIINNNDFIINDKRYQIMVNIKKNGIVNIYDKEKNERVLMIKSGFPYKGFLRHLIYHLYNFGEPKIEYYQLKKLTYRFYKECFDSVEKECKEYLGNFK